jgi:valyl-tRNA synthetase
VRFGIMISSPAGNDLLFDESSLEQGRNFNNKIWNALKLVKMWGERLEDNRQPGGNHQPASLFAITWFENRLKQANADIDALMQQFRLSEALKTLYSLIWDDFCSWYLEWVKPGFEQPVSAAIYHKTIQFFTDLMQLLHPFMPFITEEIYHLLEERTDDLCMKQFAGLQPADAEVLQTAGLLKDVITAIRDARNKNQLKPKEEIQLYIQTSAVDTYTTIQSILAKQVNATAIRFTPEAIENSIAIVAGTDKFYISSSQPVNTASQRDDLLKELEYLNGFILSVDKKLGNERFVQNAKPEVVELEKKKKSDAENKIKAIEESLGNL